MTGHQITLDGKSVDSCYEAKFKGTLKYVFLEEIHTQWYTREIVFVPHLPIRRHEQIYLYPLSVLLLLKELS